MTVPVARASARRTVRVAAGLVAGQALLCAVIGYVTLGSHGSRGPEAARMIDPRAIQPLVLPPPTAPSPTTVAPKPPPVVWATTARPRASARSRNRPEVTPTPVTTTEAPAGILVAPVPPTTDPAPVPSPTTQPEATSTSDSSGPPTPPTPPSTQVTQPTQQPVTVGTSCDPVSASGITGDGIAVQCVSGTDGVARWQTIN